MYRALYRKWRPQRFSDVVGQEAIVTALENQIRAGRIGHAYLFTGTRGTGKTTCAKIFAKAVNCLDRTGEVPCGTCEVCRGLEEGSILDVSEIDAASNNGVDDIRILRDETAFLPTVCRYKVYIIDEVHMLSSSAFNALLKTMEEPPEHVIFILATTEVQKVPATILSRCQRYDFSRITPEKIAGRLRYVAGEESIQLTEGAASLIARLADGAMRDALSILDTCAGVSAGVDEELVRRMAGVTDRQYLFEISDAIAQKNAVTALECIARLRQQSVDMRRLCMELTGHYRNLMLAGLPNGRQLLSGVSPEEEARYVERSGTSQREAVRAIDAFGEALEKMGRGTDQRIELELAVFSLTQTPAVTVSASAAAEAPAHPAPAPFAAAQVAPPPPAAAVAAPFVPSAPASLEPTPFDDLPPLKVLPEAKAPAAAPTVQYAADVPIPKPRTSPPKEPLPFAPWPQVMEILKEKGGMFPSMLAGSSAYYDGKRVLIDCNEMFRDYMRKKKENMQEVKDAIRKATGMEKCSIGPYDRPKADDTPDAASLEDALKSIQALGVDVVENN